jgi:hypothetical protein
MNDETTKKEADNSSEGDEFELRPGYDFSKGVRGKYAGRFSEGLKVEQFPEHAQVEAAQMLKSQETSKGDQLPRMLIENGESLREIERLEFLLIKIEQLTQEPLSPQQAVAIREQAQIALSGLRAYRQTYGSALSDLE